MSGRKATVLFVQKTASVKLGGLPVSYTSQSSCPVSCPLSGGGCYASSGFHTRLAWKRADGATALTWEAFCKRIAGLPDGIAWRHNVAGDLPKLADETIDTTALAMLADANKGKRGWTYTHHVPEGKNAAAIRDANAAGFTVNLSADNLVEADAFSSLGIAPVVVVLPADAPDKVLTPLGRTVQVCPEQTGRVSSCADCLACQKSGRRAIIGFRAHGTNKAKASAIAKGV